MAAFTGTPVATATYTGAQTGPLFATPPWNVTHAKWTHTATQGAGTGEVNLMTLPPGKIAIDGSKSKLLTTAFAASASLHIGFRAYGKPDRSVVAADDNYFADNLVASSIVNLAALPLPVDPISHFETVQGLTIYAMIDAGNIEDTDTIDIWIVWRHEG